MADRGAGQSVFPLSPYSVQVSYRGNGGQGSSWFGPLAPLAPAAPPEVAGRQFDYPAGANIALQPKVYEGTTFAELRALADGWDLLRLVIETRKDQVERMAWSIKPRDAKKAKAGDSRIAPIDTFFRRPNGQGWPTWLRRVLEDLFVIDAPSAYCQRNRGGKLLALLPIDGATIKPVVDDWGRTPSPIVQGGTTTYPVAYQQVLKGLPAVDYTTRDLIYRPRNVRNHKVYGFSPVEQIITTVNIALRRQLSTLSYYTEGNVPDSIIGVPETWSPDQVMAFQGYWDATFAGNVGARRHAKFVPGGVGKFYKETREPELKGEYDDWLSKVVCFAFSISPQALTKVMNRASADTQKEMAEEEGLAPILAWIKELVDDLIATEFGAPDLEFDWVEDTQADPAVEEGILTSYVGKGILTINQALDRLGYDKSSNPAADTLMVLTGTGYIPIEVNTIEGKQANLDAFGPPPTPQGRNGSPAMGEEAESNPEPSEDQSKPNQEAVPAAKLIKYDDEQPRDDSGRWASGTAHVVSTTNGTRARTKFHGVHSDPEAAEAQRGRELATVYDREAKSNGFGTGDPDDAGSQLPKTHAEAGHAQAEEILADREVPTPQHDEVRITRKYPDKSLATVHIVSEPYTNDTVGLHGAYDDKEAAQAKAEQLSRYFWATHGPERGIVDPDPTESADVAARWNAAGHGFEARVDDTEGVTSSEVLQRQGESFVAASQRQQSALDDFYEQHYPLEGRAVYPGLAAANDYFERYGEIYDEKGNTLINTGIFRVIPIGTGSRRKVTKFDDGEARDNDGRWTSGSGEGGTSAKLAEENIRRVVKGVALVAAGSLAAALAPGAPAVLVGAAVVEGIGEHMFTEAGLASAEHILAHLGIDTSRAKALVALLADVFKATAAVSDAKALQALRTRLPDVADTALDEVTGRLRAEYSDAPAGNMTAVVETLKDCCGRYKAACKGLGKAEKHVHMPFNKARQVRRPAPIPFERPATTAAMSSIAAVLTGAFAAEAKHCASIVRTALARLGKADGLDDIDPDGMDPDEAAAAARDIASRLTLGTLASEQTVAALADSLVGVASDSVERAIAQIGVQVGSDLVDQVNARAVADASDRAAELVGMRRVPVVPAAGGPPTFSLVPNPSAEWAITDTTRDVLRQVIADGLADNVGTPEIADRIMDSVAFSEERAEMVAEAEVARANSNAAMDSYRAARDDAGVRLRKEWLAEAGACAICRANADQGPIELDAPFESGDDAPPGHPKCRCAVSPLVDDDDGSAGDDDNDGDVAKVFDPNKHPRDANGQFAGAGGSGRAVKRLAQRALRNGSHQDRLDLGRVDGSRYSAAAGRDVEGWRHGVTAEFVRHIDNRHGPDSEDRNPVTAADYENLPVLLRKGAITSGGRTASQNLQTTVVTGTVRGQGYRAVLAVRKRTRSLTLHSFQRKG